MKRAAVWFATGLALAICLGGAYAAYLLAGYSWDQVVEYRTPFGDYDRPWAAGRTPPGSPGSPGTPRAVLVMIDGLRVDVTDEMPGYQTLRQYGADMVAITPQPSLSYPTWTTILSGATPDVSGVTTNWFEGPVPVETLIDTALMSGLTVAVSAPDDFAGLYGADRAQAAYLRPWSEEYMSATYVDQAIEFARTAEPALLVVHLPDVDDVGHTYGGASEEYTAMAQRIDGEVMRLVQALQDDRTLFVITADHGHLDQGGHGGWEGVVTRVPALFIGQARMLERAPISQTDIAPTVAAFLGMPVPAHAEGHIREDILLSEVDGGLEHAQAFATGYLAALDRPDDAVQSASTVGQVDVILAEARAEQLDADRASRLPLALALGAAAIVALAAIFVFSWRAGVAALAGASVYYLVYNGLYFIVHGYRWSLSAFNTETYVEQFFYTRMGEAALAGLVAVLAAAIVYPFLREHPKGSREAGFLGGWLALGPATVLAIMATLALQVAWFLWAWGAEVVWRLPDLRWGFKYDLDLTQMTAVGAVALLAPVVTYLVGRYHPRIRTQTAGE
jgi:hypothetical protein